MQYLNIKDFLTHQSSIIDVRSPAEFEQGHIPGAVSIPLFDNSERALIGMIYKENGKNHAIEQGLKFVGPKMAHIIEEVEKINQSKSLRVYCWRGGMRSSSMAWLFEIAGYECNLLEGGYKSYRRLMDSLFEDKDIILIGGETGSGKTEVLVELRNQGEQIVDLEGLANHKGSAFGSVGMPPQPSNEQFQNLVIQQFFELDPDKRVFLEDESAHIGRVSLPENLWFKMKKCPLICLNIPLETRIKRLVEDYGRNDKDELKECIRKIERKLGGQNVKSSIQFLESDDLPSVAKLMLDYYDKSYRFLLDRKKENIIGFIESQNPKANILAKLIINKIEELKIHDN